MKGVSVFFSPSLIYFDKNTHTKASDRKASVKTHPRAAHKLMKLLGSDAPQHYLARLTAEAKPWYLRPSYDQSEILIDPLGGVRAGTTTALVERLTTHEHGGKLVPQFDYPQIIPQLVVPMPLGRVSLFLLYRCSF